MVAARDGKPIPDNWALDRDGNPTTDPKAGLDGSMLPAGGVKGAMLALMFELLVTALTGARIGFEADSFFVDEGNQPGIGQAFLAIDPGALAGTDVYDERVETLLAAMLLDEGVRLPGERRIALAEAAERDGIEVPDALLAQLPPDDQPTRSISVSPSTSTSILVRRKQSSASSGWHTTGSFSLKVVLSTIGTPVSSRKASIRRVVARIAGPGDGLQAARCRRHG